MKPPSLLTGATTLQSRRLQRLCWRRLAASHPKAHLADRREGCTRRGSRRRRWRRRRRAARTRGGWTMPRTSGSGTRRGRMFSGVRLDSVWPPSRRSMPVTSGSGTRRGRMFGGVFPVSARPLSRCSPTKTEKIVQGHYSKVYSKIYV